MIIFAATAPAVPERAMSCGSKFLLNAAMRGSGKYGIGRKNSILIIKLTNKIPPYPKLSYNKTSSSRLTKTGRLRSINILLSITKARIIFPMYNSVKKAYTTRVQSISRHVFSLNQIILSRP